MTRRERVLKSLNFEIPDQVPKDLGGMLSTGISAFAYPGLVEKLALKKRPPKIVDTYQMLALPETDVLDALDCDAVIVISDEITNAFDTSEGWYPYNFNGRLSALVKKPHEFSVEDTANIWNNGTNKFQMPLNSFVFDPCHGTSIDLDTDITLPALKEYEEALKNSLYKDEKIKSIREFCKKARESTERVILISGICNVPAPPIGGGYMASILPLTEPRKVKEMNELMARYRIKQFECLLPEINDYVDIIVVASADHGIQTGPFLPPEVFRDIYTPFYRAQNDAIHRLAPGIKTFLHSCGGIYEIIDDIIDGGFDILNPVQWSAGKHSYKQWKDKCRNRISLWGGGVNSQTTLPLGSIDDIRKEVASVVEYFRQNGGFIFNSIHNILAEIAPEKIIAMYAAAKTGGK